jgi:serine/threonine protein kinase
MASSSSLNAANNAYPPSTHSSSASSRTRGGRTDPEDIYVRQDRIGKGSFGEVYKGYDKRTMRQVAIKVIDLEHAEDEISDIQQEIAILAQLDSPYVTKWVSFDSLRASTDIT